MRARAGARRRDRGGRVAGLGASSATSSPPCRLRLELVARLGGLLGVKEDVAVVVAVVAVAALGALGGHTARRSSSSSAGAGAAASAGAAARPGSRHARGQLSGRPPRGRAAIVWKPCAASRSPSAITHVWHAVSRVAPPPAAGAAAAGAAPRHGARSSHAIAARPAARPARRSASRGALLLAHRAGGGGN